MHNKGTQLFMVKDVNKHGVIRMLSGIMQSRSVHSGSDTYYNPEAWSLTEEAAVKAALDASTRQKARTEKALATITHNIEAFSRYLERKE